MGKSLVAPGSVIGSYRLGQLIGQGGMGAVYLATDTTDTTDTTGGVGTQVVLKLIRPEFAKRSDAAGRFAREATITSAISHPAFVRVLSSDIHGPQPFIAMEYVEGRTLAAVIKAEAPLTIGRTVELIRQLLSALAAAHQQNIVHRDLKPANVMVQKLPSGEERVKILDFGIAGLFDRARHTRLTQTGQILGTPGYLSPEQAKGDHVDGRADLWSVGVMLYAMLTKHLPFPGEGAAERIIALLTQPPTPITKLRGDLPPALVGVLERMLAKDPVDRYPTAVDAALALTSAARSVASETDTLSDTAPRADSSPATSEAKASVGVTIRARAPLDTSPTRSDAPPSFIDHRGSPEAAASPASTSLAATPRSDSRTRTTSNTTGASTRRSPWINPLALLLLGTIGMVAGGSIMALWVLPALHAATPSSLGSSEQTPELTASPITPIAVPLEAPLQSEASPDATQTHDTEPPPRPHPAMTSRQEPSPRRTRGMARRDHMAPESPASKRSGSSGVCPDGARLIHHQGIRFGSRNIGGLVYQAITPAFVLGAGCMYQVAAGSFTLDLTIGDGGRITSVAFPRPGPLGRTTQQCLREKIQRLHTTLLSEPNVVHFNGIHIGCF